MQPDQHKPVPDHAAGPAAELQVLIVDPDALSSAAQLLTDLPGPHSPAPTPPSAAAAGHPALTRDIGEFHQEYRAVALALATDNDTTAAHLDNSATAYHRTDTNNAAQLADLRTDLPAPRDHNNGDQDSGGGRNNDDQTDRSPELYEI